MKLSIQFKNLKEIQGKLTPESLYWPQAKDALKAIGLQGVLALRAGAPSRSSAFLGRGQGIRESISYKVNDIPRPLWVVFKIGATATPANSGARGGKTKYPYSYPHLLEYAKTLGKRSHNPNPWYQWAHNSIKKARPGFRSVVANAARDIEAKWSTS